MKKIYCLLPLVLFSACSPQVIRTSTSSGVPLESIRGVDRQRGVYLLSEHKSKAPYTITHKYSYSLGDLETSKNPYDFKMQPVDVYDSGLSQQPH